jgi:hypothetical protein
LLGRGYTLTQKMQAEMHVLTEFGNLVTRLMHARPSSRNVCWGKPQLKTTE